MAVLFIPERHERLQAAPWTETAARDGIRRIVASTLAGFDPGIGWAAHPGDQSAVDLQLSPASLYCGAAGVVWTLMRLQRDDVAAVSIDFLPFIETLAERGRRFNAAARVEPASFLLGDSGVLLLQWKTLRDAAAADALFTLAEANLRNPTHEALWGSPGTMLAALHMLDDLPESARPRWLALFRQAAQILFDQMHLARRGDRACDEAWLWTQDMYGRKLPHLGAGHGFAGNVYPILRGAHWLDPRLVDRFDARAGDTLGLLAEHDAGGVNWQPLFDPAEHALPDKPLMQDCHGAPGMVNRLAGTRSPGLQALLIKAGEAIWRAGPLKKPPGLCHGTDGNGYAFLKLHALTGEACWLERARAFAMHALGQSAAAEKAHGRMRFSLWTGDLGLAAYLSSCLRIDAALPTLDVF